MDFLSSTIKKISKKNLIPNDAIYYYCVTQKQKESFSTEAYVFDEKSITYKRKIKSNRFFPAPKPGDIYIFGDYEYRYDYYFSHGHWHRKTSFGWGAKVLNIKKEKYENMLCEINGFPVNMLCETFAYCKDLKYAPKLSHYVKNADGTFKMCTSLTEPPCFTQCTKLSTAKDIFMCCTALKAPPDFSTCTYLQTIFSAFLCCQSLKELPKLPLSLSNISLAFLNTGISGKIILEPKKINDAELSFNETEKIIIKAPPNSKTYETLTSTYKTSPNIIIY